MRVMLKLSDEQAGVLRDAVARARRVAGLVERVDDLYAQVQRQIDQRRPRCDVSGRCCRFEEYGHRLFVTTVELAAFVESVSESAPARGGSVSDALRDAPSAARRDADRRAGACPYQVDKLCSVHTVRPFGCRIFFCDPTATDWQQEQYEHFHLRLRQLHTELDVPYLYVEWLEALRAIGHVSRA